MFISRSLRYVIHIFRDTGKIVHFTQSLLYTVRKLSSSILFKAQADNLSIQTQSVIYTLFERSLVREKKYVLCLLCRLEYFYNLPDYFFWCCSSVISIFIIGIITSKRNFPFKVLYKKHISFRKQESLPMHN